MNVGKLRQLTVFEDACLGRVSILCAPEAADRLIVLKEQCCPNDAALKACTAQLLRRQGLCSPFLPEVLGSDVCGEGATRTVRAFFDYSPLQLSHLRLRGVESAVRLTRDLLGAAACLQQHKMLHGDIRPELVAFFPQTGGFKLTEKLRSTPDPRVAQRKNLARGAELFVCPKYFHDLAHGAGKLTTADLVKNESFAIGLVALRSLYPEMVTAGMFFLPGVMVFDVAGLEQVLGVVLLHAHSVLERQFLAFLRCRLLCVGDEQRLSPVDALAELERTLDGGLTAPVEFDLNRELKQRLTAFPTWCQAKSFAELGQATMFHPFFAAKSPPSGARLPSLAECVPSPKGKRREVATAQSILRYAPRAKDPRATAEFPASPATRALFRNRLISERVFRRQSPEGEALVIRLSQGDFKAEAIRPAKAGSGERGGETHLENRSANLSTRLPPSKPLPYQLGTPRSARAFSPSAQPPPSGT